jgi:hypothetical protein
MQFVKVSGYDFPHPYDGPLSHFFSKRLSVHAQFDVCLSRYALKSVMQAVSCQGICGGRGKSTCAWPITFRSLCWKACYAFLLRCQSANTVVKKFM